ncbi:hypothetical protein MKX01_003345 [Papaver californicum]|nr:hypothetical protein MKX01_003345 [Papaver californicum]
MRLLKVATCSLNQWAMDFDCNLKNIKESIIKAKEAGAVIRLGPELEITGYGCEDHFLELDTYCQLLCYNRKLMMIRPKIWLANDGNCRELRWFTAWKQRDQLEQFLLPPDVAKALSQTYVPFGYRYIEFLDANIAAEVCEELFTFVPPHGELALDGVEVFLNASASHHQLRKLDVRLRAVEGATALGGVYMYSNQQGCDGGPLYYGSQFSLKDVEVLVVQVDLDAVTSHKLALSSFREQASCTRKVASITAPYELCQSFNPQLLLSSPLKVKYHDVEEEISLGPGCWMWDYLRRSGASGFVLPLSGGADSSSVAAIVGSMCQLVYPTDSREFAKRIFYTVFMGTENSSDATRLRAKLLADGIGSWHLDVSIDSVMSSLLSLFQTLTGKRPLYKVDGRSNVENLRLQNIQARIRMVLAYMLASLLPWAHNKPGFHLVLGSSNVDEGLRATDSTSFFIVLQYNCSSADINPIGSISKQDLRAFLKWAAVNLGYSSLAAPPTKDEDDMGMQYEELSLYGRLPRFPDLLSLLEIANKVKQFFKYYSINRHKMTVSTPSYHAESYSPEDNRFDLRQFLYNSSWPLQFRKIDELVNHGNIPIVGASGEHGHKRKELPKITKAVARPCF